VGHDLGGGLVEDAGLVAADGLEVDGGSADGIGGQGVVATAASAAVAEAIKRKDMARTLGRAPVPTMSAL
jgi:hypothetical protein